MIEFVILDPDLTPNPEYYKEIIKNHGDIWQVIIRDRFLEEHGAQCAYVCSMSQNYYRWFKKAWLRTC